MLVLRYGLNYNIDMQKTFWNIFKTFFKIGTLLLGGGYVILPLLQSEINYKKGWADDDELCEYYALSQSLPGLIAANVSIFTGYKILGQKGALAALSGIIAPSFMAIILIASVLEELIRLKFIHSIFAGVGAGVVVLLLLAIKEMWNKSVIDKFSAIIFTISFLLAVMKVSPVLVILLSIFTGIIYRNNYSHKKEGEDGLP